MIRFIKKILANEKMRYLIAGGCTTAVNLVTFFLLRVITPISRNTCNAIAIAMAIAFAYFANKFFVFQSKKKGFYATLVESVQFVGARLVSMVVEILGLAILCDTFRIQAACTGHCTGIELCVQQADCVQGKETISREYAG